MDHTTSTYGRNGHAMPPSRISASRIGQSPGSARGPTTGVGGMLVGDDNRLYGAAYPGSPLDVARARPHSASPAFRPLAGSAPGHPPTHIHSPPTHIHSGSQQLQRANSSPRDRTLQHHLPIAGGGGAGGAAAARSVSASRGGGGIAAAAIKTSRSVAQQRITSSVGMSLLDRSLPAVRAAAAMEDELVAARVRVSEAREEQRKAVAAVRQLESELQDERAARVRLEDQLAAATRRGGPATAWAEPSSSSRTERRVYTGKGTFADDPRDSDGDGEGEGGASPRSRPASASASSSHLVASLKRELRSLTATRDALASQLAEIKTGSRAQRLQELQGEVERYRDEAGRQAGLVKLLSSRLDAAEAEAQEARAALQSREDRAEAISSAVPLALPPNNNLSRTTVRSALVVLQRAHKLIMAEARLVKSTFPPLLSLPELRDLAVQRPNTAGAVEALVFITTHLARLLDEVRGLPGVPRLRGPPGSSEGLARDSAAAGIGVPPRAPGSSLAADIEAQLAAVSKMQLPGASTAASIKTARAVAAVRANAIATARSSGSNYIPALAGRHERVGGRSPARTSRPASARAPTAADAARLGRGVLLTPRAGDRAEAAALREQMTGSVATLAAEARQQLEQQADSGEPPAVSRQASVYSRKSAGSRAGSALGGGEGSESRMRQSSMSVVAAEAATEAEAAVEEERGGGGQEVAAAGDAEGELAGGHAEAAEANEDDVAGAYGGADERTEPEEPPADRSYGSYGGGEGAAPEADAAEPAGAEVEAAAEEAEAQEPEGDAGADGEPAAEADGYGEPAAEAEVDAYGEPAAEADTYGEPAAEADGYGEPAAEPEADAYGEPAVEEDADSYGEPAAEAEPEAEGGQDYGGDGGGEAEPEEGGGDGYPAADGEVDDPYGGRGYRAGEAAEPQEAGEAEEGFEEDYGGGDDYEY